MVVCAVTSVGFFLGMYVLTAINSPPCIIKPCLDAVWVCECVFVNVLMCIFYVSDEV